MDKTAGSFAIVIDVSDPLHPTITEHRDLPLGALDISSDESRLVVAGSPVPEAAWLTFADTVELSEHFLLGGRADVFERADTPSGRTHTLLEGPATTIHYVALHEDTAFALEVDALSGLTGEPSPRGALWRFDLTHGYPRVRGVLRMDDVPDPLGATDGIGTRFVASSRVVAISSSDAVRLFDTRSGGTPITAGELAIDGTIALQDDRLFVTSFRELWTTDELALGGPLGDPSFDLAMHDGRAWIALGSEESVAWLELDVHDPGDLSVARSDGPPAGMLARMAWVGVPESGSQLEANDRWLIGARFDAGIQRLVSLPRRRPIRAVRMHTRAYT